MAKPKARTDTKTDLLQRVLQELKARSPSEVARETKIPLRTVARMKVSKKADPRYSRVRALAEYFWGHGA